MKTRNDIWKSLLSSEQQSRLGKIKKWVRSPFHYPALMLFNYGIYPLMKKGWPVTVQTFFGTNMQTILPSGTDLMLNGIKSHDSEIRLSKFLTLQLKQGDTFIDIGAHYGYYTLLASVLVGGQGNIYSIEASASSFNLLRVNTKAIGNIQIYHAAAGDVIGEITFYEFPGPYSEYNTIIKDAYQSAGWAKKIKPLVTKVDTLVLDEFITRHNIQEAIIKIDVEGGELSVIKGMLHSLISKQLVIVMEYLSYDAQSLHADAAGILFGSGYTSYAITHDGQKKQIHNIEEYLKDSKRTSDNIVFSK